MSIGCLIRTIPLNDESKAHLLIKDRGSFNFKYNYGIYHVLDDKNPSQGVAYDEQFIRSLFLSNKLDIAEVTYGNWCGRYDILHAGQDCIIALKRVKE